MNRRRFIATGAMALGAAALGLKTKPESLPAGSLVRPCYVPKVNPDWINAPYEPYFLLGRDAFKPLSPYAGVQFGVDPNPLKAKLNGRQIS